MRIKILTLFPEMFESVFNTSILGRAREAGHIEVECIDIRPFSDRKHKNTDDYPFGGGAGMVMLAQPIMDAMASVTGPDFKGKRLFMGPRGKTLTQQKAAELAKEEELVILCGHYEGVDQRVLDYWEMEEVSIGDYILTGGELPAMVLIDTVARMVPEVLGNGESHLEESIYSGLLEYPHYTKPREYCGMETPEVLLSGNHKNIHMWRLEQSLRLTKERRPDLWAKYLKDTSHLTKQEKKLLQSIIDEENR